MFSLALASCRVSIGKLPAVMYLGWSKNARSSVLSYAILISCQVFAICVVLPLTSLSVFMTISAFVCVHFLPRMREGVVVRFSCVSCLVCYFPLAFPLNSALPPLSPSSPSSLYLCIIIDISIIFMSRTRGPKIPMACVCILYTV